MKIPDRVFWNLLATWPAALKHPAWRDRPELKAELARIEQEGEEQKEKRKDQPGVIKKVDRRF